MPDYYQKEIEDILRKAEEDAPLPLPQSKQSLRSLIWQYVRQSLSGSGWSITPGRLMLAAVSILLAALVLRFMLPGVVGPLAWVGLIIFIIAYGMFFVGKPANRNAGGKMWRGRYIDDEPNEGGQSLLDRIRRRFRG